MLGSPIFKNNLKLTSLLIDKTALVSIAFVLLEFVCAAQSKEIQASDKWDTLKMKIVADSVAAAFDKHQFVFLGSTHGGKKSSEFLLCLLSRPAFQQRVNNVLVEWANPVYQAMMDRYFLTLDNVPMDSLRRTWFDTDRPQLWASLPQISEFFVAVRAINARLEPAKRIRIIGGCEPVNWATVRTADDIALCPFKSNWATHVIIEHFAKRSDECLLVVYGDGHIHHNGGTMMSELETKIDRARLFVVGTIPDLEEGESDRVALLGNPAQPFVMAARNFPSTFLYPKALFYVTKDSLASYVDEIIYLGPDHDRNLENSIELSKAELAELNRRDMLKGDPRYLMKIRLQHKDVWFRQHPTDIPERP